MIDIKILRENPELVKENMRKKFQDNKLQLVDEVLQLDKRNRQAKLKGDELRKKRNELSSEIGSFMKKNEMTKVEDIKAEVANINNELATNEKLETELTEKIKILMT